MSAEEEKNDIANIVEPREDQVQNRRSPIPKRNRMRKPQQTESHGENEVIELQYLYDYKISNEAPQKNVNSYAATNPIIHRRRKSQPQTTRVFVVQRMDSDSSDVSDDDLPKIYIKPSDYSSDEPQEGGDWNAKGKCKLLNDNSINKNSPSNEQKNPRRKKKNRQKIITALDDAEMPEDCSKTVMKEHEEITFQEPENTGDAAKDKLAEDISQKDESIARQEEKGISRDEENSEQGQNSELNICEDEKTQKQIVASPSKPKKKKKGAKKGLQSLYGRPTEDPTIPPPSLFKKYHATIDIKGIIDTNKLVRLYRDDVPIFQLEHKGAVRAKQVLKIFAEEESEIPVASILVGSVACDFSVRAGGETGVELMTVGLRYSAGKNHLVHLYNEDGKLIEFACNEKNLRESGSYPRVFNIFLKNDWRKIYAVITMLSSTTYEVLACDPFDSLKVMAFSTVYLMAGL